MDAVTASSFQSVGQVKCVLLCCTLIDAMPHALSPSLGHRRDALAVQRLPVWAHMLNDQPRLFFMHFWANDDVSKLARGLRAALAKVNTAKQ